MEDSPLTGLPLVGLLAVPSALAFLWLEPVAALAIVSTLLVVLAGRIMLGSAQSQRRPGRVT